MNGGAIASIQNPGGTPRALRLEMRLRTYPSRPEIYDEGDVTGDDDDLDACDAYADDESKSQAQKVGPELVMGDRCHCQSSVVYGSSKAVFTVSLH